MSTETELKLSLDPEDPAIMQRLQQHPLLAATPKQRRLYNTYFDTADLALAQHKIAVRERRVEGINGTDKISPALLLTVKTAGKSHHGFSQRQEWEAPTRPGAFDFRALVDNAALADALCDYSPRLLPVFTTDFVRQSWLVDYDGNQIEVAFDRGTIVATAATGPHGNEQTQQSTICELELELKSGDAAALTTLAGQLGERIRLTPSDVSKAARGYRLFRALTTTQANLLAQEKTPDSQAPGK